MDTLKNLSLAVKMTLRTFFIEPLLQLRSSIYDSSISAIHWKRLSDREIACKYKSSFPVLCNRIKRSFVVLISSFDIKSLICYHRMVLIFWITNNYISRYPSSSKNQHLYCLDIHYKTNLYFKV